MQKGEGLADEGASGAESVQREERAEPPCALGVIFMTSALQRKRREKAGLEKMFRKITEIL